MNNTNNRTVFSIALISLFAAMSFLGIQVFRIPIPAAVGTPFLHFGHIFVVMGALLLGGKKGAVSGVIGFVIFDLLNGYVHAIPKVFVGTVIKCLVIGWIMYRGQKAAAGDKKKEYKYVIFATVVSVIITLIDEFFGELIPLLIVGSGLKPALIAVITSLPATLINGVFTIVGVLVIYPPVKRALDKTNILPKLEER